MKSDRQRAGGRGTKPPDPALRMAYSRSLCTTARMALWPGRQWSTLETMCGTERPWRLGRRQMPRSNHATAGFGRHCSSRPDWQARLTPLDLVLVHHSLQLRHSVWPQIRRHLGAGRAQTVNLSDEVVRIRAAQDYPAQESRSWPVRQCSGLVERRF